MEKFDAYHKWLGIPPEEQPPNYYRLLGVRLFETDPDVISTAADQRMFLLRSRQTGPHAAQSQALLNEVAVAIRTLSDAQHRRAYDQKLRAELSVGDGETLANATTFGGPSRSGSGTIANLAGSVSQLAAASDDLTLDVSDLTTAATAVAAPPVPPTPTTPPKSVVAEIAAELPELTQPALDLDSLAATTKMPSSVPLARQKSTGPPPAGFWSPGRIVVAAGSTVAVVAIVALAMALSTGSADNMAHSGNPVPPVTDSKQPSSPPSDKKPPSSTSAEKNAFDPPVAQPDAKPEAPPSVDNAAKQPAPIDNEESPASAGKTPPEPDDPGGHAPSASTAKSDVDAGPLLPGVIELPPPEKLEEFVLIRYADADLAAVEYINVRKEATRLRDHEFFQFKRDESEPNARRFKLFLAALRGPPPIKEPLAELRVDGRTVKFRWLPDAKDHPESLQFRNCVIEIGTQFESEPHAMVLRKPREVPAILLDFDQKEQSAEVAVELPPRLESLQFEIGGLEAFPAPAALRGTASAPIKTPLGIDFQVLNQDDRPEIRVNTSVVGEGKYAFTLKPVISTPLGEFDLTLKNVAQVKAKAETLLRAANADQKKAETALRQTQNELAAVQRQAEKAASGNKGMKVLSEIVARRDALKAEVTKFMQARDDAALRARQAEGVHKSVPAVEELVRKLHKTAKLEFRIYTQSGVSHVVLVQTPGFGKRPANDNDGLY